MILSGKQPVQHVNCAARSVFFIFLALTFRPCINAQTDAGIRRDSLSLDLTPEKVTDGYVSGDKTDFKGSVSVVMPLMLNAYPSDNLSSLLQGRASGVTVTGSGQPGESSKVRIRGFSSFLDNDPLYIVDGTPSRDISFLNPNDVESLSVLKDAGSSSVYGSRASNGVIIITTKRGEKGFNVNYDMTMGVQSPGKGTRDDVLTTKEYADLQWLVYKNDGTVETHPIYGYSGNTPPSMPFWAANTDWYDEITDPAGIMKQNLSISGGSENASFYAGFGVINQNGIVIHTHNTKYNARINSDFSFLGGRIRAGESFSFSIRNALNVPNLSEGSPVHIGPYRSQAIIPVIMTEAVSGFAHDFVPGEWGGTGIAFRLGDTPNPVADLTRNKDNYFIDNRLTGSLYLDFSIINGLNFRSTFSGTMDSGRGKYITSPTYERAYSNISTMTVTEISSGNSDWIWSGTLTFEREIGEHKILALAGYEALKNDIGNAVVNTDTSYYTETRMLSSFFKADYSFLGKYLLGVTLRRDGCSRFSESQRFAYFPSFSAGWHLSNEPFVGSLSWISNLKIRGSWGKTGNQFAILPRYSAYTFGADIGGSYYDIYGTFNSPAMGYYPYQAGNPDIKWEENFITDIGLDAGLFNDRVRVIFDWYSKKSGDLLYNPTVAGTAGQASPPFINIGSMKNTGIDMELSYQRKWDNFGVGTNFILTAFKNNITNISDVVTYFEAGESKLGALVRNEEGYPLSSYYGYNVAGIFKTQYEVDKAPDQDGAQPGFFRFVNTDTTSTWWGDQTVNSLDRTFIGNPNPEFTYSLNFVVTWKNFDISGFFYGSQGNEIFNYNKWYTDFWSSYQGQKSKALLYDSWTAAKTDASIPKATNYSGFSSNTQVCSYYIEDGSYLRLKSLQLGYSLPADQLSRIRIKSLRVYLQTVNLLTLTKYSGLDPEIGGSDLASGIDNGNYPNVKQFLFGISLSL